MMQDHKRGCQGREYTCTCGYDEKVRDLADWSNLPKDIYVVGASIHGLGVAFDVTCCSVPMVMVPEVRYTRADLIAPPADKQADGLAERLTKRARHLDTTGGGLFYDTALDDEAATALSQLRERLAAVERERDDAEHDAARLHKDKMDAIDALLASEAKALALTTALQRIATSNLADMNTPHPEHCAVIARAALEQASKAAT